MRVIWVDEGNDPQYAKLRTYGIDTISRSIRDSRTTLDALKADRAQGFACNVYAASNWWPELNGPQFASKVSGLLQTVAPGTAPDFPSVCLDMETHDRDYLMGALRQWRKHRPERVTDWTLEGHQGGILTTADWLIVFRLVRYVVPQSYNGAMTATWDTCAMARDLYDHGLPFGSVYPFVDAAHLQEWWAGYAFTQGRLP